jgi:preprotein translocase subunit SecD
MSVVNHYPLWKNLLILAVFVGGVLTALPNAFGDDPAVQVSHPSIAADAKPTIARVEAALAAAGLTARSVALEDGKVIARFDDPEVQLKAMEAVKAALDGRHGVALNLAARTPQWLRDLGLKPMNLGLDLRGGVHFLLQVDM